MDLNREVDKSKYGAADMPLYPARTLFFHVGLKGIQAGSVLGFLFTPLYKYKKRIPLSQSFITVMPRSAFVVGVLSLGLLYGKNFKGDLTDDGVDDRAYRIAHNVGQNTVDKYSVICGFLGASVGSIVGKLSLRWIVSCSLGGIGLGVVGYSVVKSEIYEKLKSKFI
jgi:hypothetical protein